jgi:hypothetical protein
MLLEQAMAAVDLVDAIPGGPGQMTDVATGRHWVEA